MSTPPKRVSEMTESERLESLKEWAEEQKYVRPGEGGTLPFGIRNMQGLAYGGPVRFVNHQYEAPIAPPSYDTVMRQDSASERKKGKSGPVKKWLERRREKREAKRLSTPG